ncbi:hypothetical protein CPHLJ_3g780 [Cryptosporidium parvum]|uniref:Cgd3_780 protein n=1 Tax=Cryptosporidium parvum TaxID=5807 RepID=F0X4I2_CRYPV|nr:K Homology domain type 1/ Exosome complex RNA-binding protein [Cryptosporidium parvum]WKS76820.1 hypothetical protein CPCDC_3g780 [Cryptosporidium sp. 43IA8]WRK31312.1 K Homology domain type 1/ Exosome complex RNA-binding protein [Cryptosporidium parvum]|eukprot:QOY42427.1 hypothetical protein CPATCC_001063 [Cryptosporidium parvum]
MNINDKISDDFRIVLPGEEISINSQESKKNKIAGVECKRPYWPYDRIVLPFKGCYIPRKGDVVVGTIINKLGEFYKVSLNCSHDGILPDMAFEGATKRNKPNLVPGNYVCSRINYVDLESGEIELTCITPEEKKTWSNNENYLGVLKNSNYKNTNIIEDYSKSDRSSLPGESQSCIKDGMTVTVPQSVAQILLADQSYVLEALSKYFAYEICVGQNGIIWFSASNIKEMLLIMSALKVIPNCTKPQLEVILESFWSKIQSQS